MMQTIVAPHEISAGQQRRSTWLALRLGVATHRHNRRRILASLRALTNKGGPVSASAPPSIPIRILVAFGTRPEAIKMAPLVHRLQAAKEFDVRVCVTGQHREMLEGVLDLFDIRPAYDLDVMRTHQDLTDLTSSLLSGMRNVLSEWKPARVLVHGDTTTTFAASLAAYYARVPVGHVEAGLRTRDIYRPWPEEINRRLVDSIADLLFAPTQGARKNLLHEGVPEERIEVTGNTVIDALRSVSDMLDANESLSRAVGKQFRFLDEKKKLLLVTGHRRESFGEGFESICAALLMLARRSDVEVVYPVHLNPNVQRPVKEILADQRNIHLIPPLDYLPFVYLMKRSYMVITDSGGVQEEAPSLGKPVLVMRDVTERPEAVVAGTVKLVGTAREKIVDSASALLDDEDLYSRMARAINPYGDGRASERIVRRCVLAHAVPALEEI